MDDLDDEIDELEDLVGPAPVQKVGRRLRDLRQDVRGIRRTLTPTRDAVRRIVDDRVELDEGELFPRHVEIAFGDAYDKLLRATEALESSRDALGGVRDFLQGKIANDQNEVMKRLTVIASLLLVPTFIVGLYGQNFRHIPELAWGYGYWWSWGVDHPHDDRPARVLPLETVDLSSEPNLRAQQTLGLSDRPAILPDIGCGSDTPCGGGTDLTWARLRFLNRPAQATKYARAKATECASGPSSPVSDPRKSSTGRGSASSSSNRSTISPLFAQTRSPRHKIRQKTWSFVARTCR